MAKVKLPYGIDNFAKLRNSNCYYIDKTRLIEELLSEVFDVNLITRPCRFGKTLTMRMFAEFFDIRKNSGKLFDGLEISKDTEICTEWMNQWPVLFLTLKDVDGRRFDRAYGLLKNVISDLCKEHSYLADSNSVDQDDKEIFSRLKAGKANEAEVQCALATLLRMMKAHYGKEVILFVDEYDVPLAKASDNGYYEDMLEMIRSFLGMVWKSNPNLKFAVVTGCLRIAKESIFTGANNFISNSISSKRYQDYFGFSEEEVSVLLQTVSLQDALPTMKKWYDGYIFGRKEVLLSGGVIQEPIHEDLTYDVAHSSEDNLWSILYLTGYLTQVLPGKLPEGMKPEKGKVALRITNEEVRSVFGGTVKKWFEDRITTKDRTGLFNACWGGDDGTLTQEVTDILFGTISYYDYKEDFYHAFVAGMFLGAGYEVRTNAEQGLGRADIIVKDLSRRRAIVIEAKWLRKRKKGSPENLDRECSDALKQIEEKEYRKNLLLDGYTTVLCYGAAFQGKTCLIKLAG